MQSKLGINADPSFIERRDSRLYGRPPQNAKLGYKVLCPVILTARRAPALTTELCPYEVAIGLGTSAVIANFRQWTVSLGQAAEVCRHTDGRGGVGDHALVVNYAYHIWKLFRQ